MTRRVLYERRVKTNGTRLSLNSFFLTKPSIHTYTTIYRVLSLYHSHRQIDRHTDIQTEMSLENLFDSPSPPRPARPQGGNPLFLQSPTPSVASPPARAKRPLSSTKGGAQKDLALRLFDDDDDNDEIGRLAGSGNLRAEDRSDGELGVGEEEKTTNKRRAPLKVNIQRLQEPIGLRRLAELSKNRAKIKGKGHERTDLNNLMNDYRIWTHQLFPKTDFSSTVRDIENLCHTRMSRRILDDLQASLLDGSAPSEIPSSELEPNPNSNRANNTQMAPTRSPSSSLSRPTATTRSGDNSYDDGDDIDAMIAAAEAENRPSQSISPSVRPSSTAYTHSLSKGKQPLFNEPDDDAEEDWSILDEIEQSNTASMETAVKRPEQQTSAPSGRVERAGEEDEADWAMFDEAHGS